MAQTDDEDRIDYLIASADEFTTYEDLCDIFNKAYRPMHRLDADKPILSIDQAVDRFAEAQYNLGWAASALQSPYPPPQAKLDYRKSSDETSFLRLLISRSVSREMTKNLSEVQTISALTLKAALSGAFDKGE